MSDLATFLGQALANAYPAVRGLLGPYLSQPSWLDQARAQTQRQTQAFDQGGGLSGMLAVSDPGLYAGFGGTTRNVGGILGDLPGVRMGADVPASAGTDAANMNRPTLPMPDLTTREGRQLLRQQLSEGMDEYMRTAPRPDISAPLSRMDRDWQNYGQHMTPDQVMASEPVWGAAALGAVNGTGRAEAFAAAANDMWQRMGANRYITPEMARRYMAVEEARMRGIRSVGPQDNGSQ